MPNNYIKDSQIAVGEYALNIYPVKMKYMKSIFYNSYLLLQAYGATIFSYPDGSNIWNNFLASVFDNDLKVIEYINNNLNENIVNELLSKVKKINEIENDEEYIEKVKNNTIESDKKTNKKDGIDFRRGYAMLGIYCGLSETVLDECSYLYYKDCLKELSIKTNWDITLSILSQPVLSQEGQEANKQLIEETHPFNFEISNKENVIPEGNTLEGLKKLGIDVKVAKVNDFVPISEMFKNSKKKNDK